MEEEKPMKENKKQQSKRKETCKKSIMTEMREYIIEDRVSNSAKCYCGK